MLTEFQLPSPPVQPADHGYPLWRRWFMDYSDRIYNYLQTYIGTSIRNNINAQLIGAGPDIVSAATITITNMVHRVSGTATITTILQPTGQTAYGPLCLQAQAGFSIATGGNISPAMTVAAGHGVILFFSPNAGTNGQWFGVTS